MSTKRMKVEETMASFADNEEFNVDTRDLSPAHILTKIKSFSSLSKHGISQIESMEFEAGGSKWKLIIYPDGDEQITSEVKHISLCLSAVGTDSQPTSWEINAMVNFFIYNHISDNYLCFQGKRPRRFHAINSKWGISKFMDKERFTHPSNGYLLNDNCVFGVEVFVLKNQRLVENVSVLNKTDPHKREWKITDFSKLENVWNSEEFSVGGFKWKIALYPKGVSRLNGRYTSIFVECVDSKSFAANKKVKATCFFLIRHKTNGGKNLCMAATHWFTSSERVWGFAELVETGEVSKDYIVNDCCNLEIRLSVEVVQEPLKLK